MEKQEAYNGYDELPEVEKKAIDNISADVMSRFMLQAYRCQVIDEIADLIEARDDDSSISFENQSEIRDRKKELGNCLLSEIALCADDFKNVLTAYNEKDSGIVEWLIQYASDEALRGTLSRIEQAQNNFSVLHTLIKSEQLRRASRKRDKHR